MTTRPAPDDRHACAVAGCDRLRHKRTWCGPHYKRWWRLGSPTAGRAWLRGEPLRWLHEAVRRTDVAECIVWPFGSTGGGYGAIRYLGRTRRAHVVALELAGRPSPGPAYQAAHAPVVCHNRLCVNVRHLRWATQSENSADMALDGTLRTGSDVRKLAPAAVLPPIRRQGSPVTGSASATTRIRTTEPAPYADPGNAPPSPDVKEGTNIIMNTRSTEPSEPDRDPHHSRADDRPGGRWRHPVPPSVAEFVNVHDGYTGRLETAWAMPTVEHPQGFSAPAPRLTASSPKAGA